MKKFLFKIGYFISLLHNHLNGNFAYHNYLSHQQKNHPQKQPLSKKEFLRSQEKMKWQKVNRCC